ncbi:helix-turn-helix domain-containing protein [Algoriphagus machipongonensis]|uniref:Toxin-antitoxin system, antitoxin component, Xre family n=1 Tax=Algoriphagus machipongonensis TaxID=388413 RepID=A3I2V3_9BACT|nr:XRE family transcriptional regulator [Algoriphagus machipongonensis]EAZ79152.1 putative toxin-antitoxin system, antitoxin component, Xre family [Algoriphagus machipongonensis]
MTSPEHLTIQIGNKIKGIRKEKGWKLGEFADKSGMSIAMLSKIENGRVIPTIPSLMQIINTLNLNLADFFSDLKVDGDFNGFIFRKKEDYVSLSKEEDSVGYHYQMILNFPIDKASMEISLLTLDSHAQREKLSTSGFEYIYLIKGKLTYELGDETLEMEEGDSLFFDGEMPHVPKNTQSNEAILLVVYFITMN